MPLVVATLALILLLRGVWHYGHGRFHHGTLHMLGGFPLLAICAVVGLFVVNTQTFARLSYERPIAEIDVAAVDPNTQLYRVTVHRLDGVRISIPPAR